MWKPEECDWDKRYAETVAKRKEHEKKRKEEKESKR